MRSSCSPDVTFYPFDKQTCSFALIPWGNTVSEIQFVTINEDFNMESYTENGEWEILSTKTSTSVANSTPRIDITLTVLRKPLYFAFNIILPILVLTTLNGMVFWLPVESGERVGFSVTCFLAFSVILNMIMDILPRSSSPIAYMCFYTVSMMVFSGMTTALVILQLRIFHKPNTEKVPKCLIIFMQFWKCQCRKWKKNNDKVVRIPVEPTQDTGGKPEKSAVADNEDEIGCQDIARFLDSFLFLAFLIGQSFFTVSFIVPLGLGA